MTVMEQHRWKGIRPFQRHGLVLMVAGMIFMGIGFSYVFTVSTPGRELSLQILLLWSPMWLWGYAFVLAGILAVISSRWPPISKTWGYMVLSGLSAGWAATYLAGMTVPPVVNLIVEGVEMEAAPWSNLSAVAIWGLMSFMWVAISGLINADDILSQGPIIVEDDGALINTKELI